MEYKRATQTVWIDDGEDFKVDVITNFSAMNDKIAADLEASGKKQKIIDMAPYFAIIWDSARGLLNALKKKPDSFYAGRTICEIGCGLALPSMYVTKRGGRAVAIDLHPDVPIFLERNLAMNNIPDCENFKYIEVDWRDNAEAIFSQNVHVIIGSDILYDDPRAKSVADFLNEAINFRGIEEAIIADPNRSSLLIKFTEQCVKHNLAVSQEKVSVHVDGKNPIDIFLLTIKQNAGA